MTRNTTIPNADGEITIQDSGINSLVEEHKAMDIFSKVLGKMIGSNKILFRREAMRQISEAAPGVTRVSFTDGKGNAIMVSKPDLVKGGTRKKLSAKLLAAIGSVLDLTGCVESAVKGFIAGNLLELLKGMKRDEPILLVTGELVDWVQQVCTANGVPAEGPSGGYKTFTVSEEELTIVEELKLTADAAASFHKQLLDMQAAAPEKKADPKMYDAIKALVEDGLSAPTVNVR